MFLYAATIFLSAFLLFLVQPIIAKQILPWFGGAASVWATCLVFFQTMLLFGYAYADWSTRSLKPRTQAMLHIALLAREPRAAADHPRRAAGSRAPTRRPARRSRSSRCSARRSGSSTSCSRPRARSCRRGSGGATTTRCRTGCSRSRTSPRCSRCCRYPVAIEPVLTLVQQSISWSVGLRRVRGAVRGDGDRDAAAFERGRRRRAASAAAAAARHARPRSASARCGSRFPATGSCLLLAVTNHLTQNIASIPFLWVVPLSIYLITFILCFDHPRWYVRPLFLAGRRGACCR